MSDVRPTPTHWTDASHERDGTRGLDFGGGEMIDDPAIGHILGPNITSGEGSRAAKCTARDWDRIVRHGVKPGGKPAVMPSDDFFKMSDRELSDVIAFITSRPAVQRSVDAPSFGPVGKVLVALGKFPLSAYTHPDHQRAHAERSLTQGVSKDGRVLLLPMSLLITHPKAMTPLERRALWTYFNSLPPTATNH